MTWRFDDLHHLSAAYVLDALDADERAAFERHYPSCEICAADVRIDRETTSVIADAVATTPPAHLKAGVMAEISRTRQLPPVVGDPVVDLAGRRSRRVGAMAVAAAAVVVMGLLAWGLFLQQADSDNIGDLIAAPDSIVTSLVADDDDGGAVRVVWSAERDEVAVLGNSLADPGPDRAYALWLLGADGSATPAGLFNPNSGGSVRTVLLVDNETPSAWGVTLEPATGSPQPTTAVIYLGEI
jgi:anti-sigma-K factor RskA